MYALQPWSAHHTSHAVGNKFNYTDSAWTWADPTQGKKEVTFHRSGPVATEMKSSREVGMQHTHTHIIHAYSFCQKVKLSSQWSK